MEQAPQLAAPGAGLPLPELLIGRVMFFLYRHRGGRESHADLFRHERDAILELVAACPPAARGERVLIERLRGLEDSSRHWSVWMTLDHLRICNEAFGSVIQALAAGSPPAEKASTAAVKPSPRAGADCEESFRRSCDDFLAVAAAVPDLRTRARYEHPWFGAMDAAAWHALNGLHLRIHHRQIARITDGLRG